MWDLTKILSARIPVSEAAAERPIFRLDPMNEDRIRWSVLISLYIQTLNGEKIQKVKRLRDF